MTQESAAKPPASRGAESFLWWKRSDQRFLGMLLLVLTAALGIQWARLNGWLSFASAAAPLTPEQARFVIEINSATWMEWAQLDGIGETLARRIVQDREDRGPFTVIDDVSRVKGIGDKTMERIRSQLRLREDARAEE